MITLIDTTQSLEITTSSANALHYEIAYNDSWNVTTDGITVTHVAQGSASGTIADATTTKVVDEPPDGYVRTVRTVFIYAAGGANNVIVSKNAGGTPINQTRGSLSTNYSLELTWNGWKVLTDTGETLVTSPTVNVTGGGGGGGGGVAWEDIVDSDFTAVDDIGYSDSAGTIITGSHNIDVSGITTLCGFCLHPGHGLVFTGETVYQYGGYESIDGPFEGAVCYVRRIGSRLVLTY